MSSQSGNGKEGNGEEKIDDVIAELSELPLEVPSSRPECDKCLRPACVCLCPFIPDKPIVVESKLIILQHPSEEKRRLRTARILEVSLPRDKCTVIRGKRFSANKHGALEDVLKNKDNSLLLFPGPTATVLEDIPPQPHNIVVIDGTWAQARCIYHNSPDLNSLKKVMLNVTKRSNYIIRTQPTEESLSTVESAAITLAHLERNCKIYDLLMKPLNALCTFQLEHGAVDHLSKEFLILNGLYSKPIGRKLQKKLGLHMRGSYLERKGHYQFHQVSNDMNLPMSELFLREET
ncbi:DTW domain containing 2 [Brevipalpus obovatus]|uniref:DTW domain containing 2 n=1 Tax=Brevipalpus obovatus TaxID=246614 RepID=UPI003D9F0B69